MAACVLFGISTHKRVRDTSLIYLGYHCKVVPLFLLSDFCGTRSTVIVTNEPSDFDGFTQFHSSLT
jgi:hypothetical protein